MFTSSRHKYSNDSFSKSRVGKSSSKQKRSFREHGSGSRRPADLDISSARQRQPSNLGVPPGNLTSAIVTLSVGPPSSVRLFAAHEDVLSHSPYFQSALRSAFYNPSNAHTSPLSTPNTSPNPAASPNSNTKQLALPGEIPEVFSSVLEYMYKGDYFPKLEYDRRRNTWALENAAVSPGNSDSTVWVPAAAFAGNSLDDNPALDALPAVAVLKDTVIYCAAERYGLPELQRLALRKQGLQSGIPVATILASARFAYANTPESDSKLRGHYLQLIIRSRGTFKRSGTMQMQMGGVAALPVDQGDGRGLVSSGTGLWFDLFVAMCNHLDDMEKIAKSPRK